MVPGTTDVESLYRQHLTTADRALLDGIASGASYQHALGHPDTETAVFTAGRSDSSPMLSIGDPAPDPFGVMSPFAVFAVAVHRTADRLAGERFVHEWVAPRQRIPVFDVEPLRELLADPLRRFFLVELLSSYTHVSSGVRWERTRRGWRRRRWSELDPVQLAELLDVVSADERPGVLRRLGDLALFLTGVFPDHTAVTGLGDVDAERLIRLSGGPGRGPGAIPPGGDGPVRLLEHLGARWYGAAAASVPGRPTGSVAVVAHLGEHFSLARRILNLVTDRYLFPLRSRWFGTS